MTAEQVAEILRKANEQMGISRSPFLPYLHEVYQDDTGKIWLDFFGEFAFLGNNFDTALLTAIRGDWWLPSRDGLLNDVNLDLFSKRKDQEVREDEFWANHLHQNRALAQGYVSRSKRMAPRNSDMDAGEEATPEDFELVKAAEQENPIPVTQLKFYELIKSESRYALLGTKQVEYHPGFYTKSDKPNQWRRLELKVRPDGYGFRLGPSQSISSVGRGPVWRGEIIIENNEQGLLNFHLYDRKGTLILRLVGEKEGKVQLYEFNLNSLS